MTNKYSTTGILCVTLLSSFFMLRSILTIMERIDEPISATAIAQHEEDVKVQKVLQFLAKSDL